MSTMDTQTQILIEQKVANNGKNMVLAYVFWFFLGFFSAHRFYLGSPVAVVQLILNFFIIGLLWTLIDLFLIPGMVKQKNDALRREYETELRLQRVESR